MIWKERKIGASCGPGLARPVAEARRRAMPLDLAALVPLAPAAPCLPVAAHLLPARRIPMAPCLASQRTAPVV